VTTDAVPRQQLDTQVSLVHQLRGHGQERPRARSRPRRSSSSTVASPRPSPAGWGCVWWTPGNIVHATDTGGLVIVTQLQPITVIFTIPEDSVPTVLQRLQRGVRLPVEAYDREYRRKLAEGALLTIDNQVDPTTGTVRLKAQFPNTDYRLFPSQFVNARLLIDTPARRDGWCRPRPSSRARGGRSSTCCGPTRPWGSARLTVGVTDGDDVSIERGLAVGEQVVVEGAERLRDGAGHRPAQGLMNLLAPVHPAAGRHDACSWPRCCWRAPRVSPVADLRSARGGLPDHPGLHVLPGGEPGRHGVVGHRPARAVPRADARAEPDDLHQLGRQLGDHAAVHP